ncbi:MAG: acetylornithine deacetylase [Nitrospirae bacterium]|nr:acetylornithine deacetylase [Nitrospirota bacterium]
MLTALVAAPSVSSARPGLDQGNRPVIDLLAGWLDDLGFSCEVMPIPDRPGKANLIATLGRGPGGLVLAGHTDTVPFDAGRWRHDPFTLTVANGRLYGLGTADMKGFFPLAIEAVRGLDAGRLTTPLIVLATADEETSMSGAKALVAAGRPAARHAVIGEPTSLKPVHLHKGIMMEAIHITGRSGHSSDPSQGVNALDAMYRVLGELMDWRARLAERYTDARFKVPVPTLNLGHIHGGDNPNRICPDCTLHIDLRPLPGMAIEALRAELQERVTHAVRGSGATVRFEALFDGVPPLETPRTAPIVRAAEELTGTPAGAVTFGTEGPFLTAMGMDTVILGPGDLAQAHQPDEYLALDRIAPTIDLLRNLAHRFCMA